MSKRKLLFLADDFPYLVCFVRCTWRGLNVIAKLYSAVCSAMCSSAVSIAGCSAVYSAVYSAVCSAV